MTDVTNKGHNTDLKTETLTQSSLKFKEFHLKPQLVTVLVSFGFINSFHKLYIKTIPVLLGNS